MGLWSKVKKGVGSGVQTLMGKTDMRSVSQINPYQQELLMAGANALKNKLPSAIDVMSKGMTSMDNAYDAAGSAGVLAAM
jgi:hypothetical protein